MSNLTLENKNGNINDDLITIIQQLWDYVPKPKKKKKEIVKLKNILNKAYNPDEPVKRYLKKIQTTRNNLIKFEADLGTPKIIHQAVCAFEKHTKLETLTSK